MDYLDLVRQFETSLEPRPTGMQPRLRTIDGVRAVLFDVYGTLVISASGDISLTSGASHADAMIAALEAVGVTRKVGGDELLAAFLEAIERDQRTVDYQYPEVDIRHVWSELLAGLQRQGSIDGTANVDCQQLAIEYEMRVNPVAAMPGASRLLSEIRQSGVELGIVSNAQFFTPMLFPVLLGGTTKELGFCDDHCFWSYQHLQAKPGAALYEKAVEALAARGITPAEVLYVGNDRLNDVTPAARCGMRTVLFAGDARSLRLRDGDPRAEGAEADVVITDLGQVSEVLRLASP